MTTLFISDLHLEAGQPEIGEQFLSFLSGEAWRPLTTAQCAEMRTDGLIDFGTHTHTHADFRSRPQTLYEELKTSVDFLRSQFGMEDATFAFPYGTRRLGFSGPVLAGAAKQAGVLCSLTTEEDLVPSHSDPFDWGRFTVSESDNGATLAGKLDGWYSLLRNVWQTVWASR